MSKELVDTNIRINLFIDYKYVTTTDFEKILSSIRVPIMKELQREGLAGNRDQLHIKFITSEKSIYTEIGIFVILTVAALGIEKIAEMMAKNIVKLLENKKEELVKTSQRENINQIKIHVTKNEEIDLEIIIENGEWFKR